MWNCAAKIEHTKCKYTLSWWFSNESVMIKALVNENAPALTHLPRIYFVLVLPYWRYLTSWRQSVPSDWCYHSMMSSVTSCDVMISHQRSGFCIRSLKLDKVGKSRFLPRDLDLWPMTLTIKLGLDFIKFHACTKFHARTSNGLAVRALTNWQTETRIHGQTETRDRFYYLDRWRGR